MRWVRRSLLVAAALAAGLFFAFFSVDLGPAARAEAEKRATAYLERPMHIGRVKALVWPGRFELDDVVIEGVSKTDEPFLRAKKIRVDVTWRTLLHWWKRDISVDVNMTDWSMAVETWSGRPSSLPKLMPKGDQKRGRLPFTTTVRVSARRGQFSYFDHGAPWSVVAPNLSFDLVHDDNLNAYVGRAHFDKGTVRIQDFLPMSADMTTKFQLDGAHVILHRIDLVTDGARTKLNGEVYLGKSAPGRPGWPEQTYNINESQIDFTRMRELFFARESWRVAGQGRFAGKFHISQAGRRELTGRFTSPALTLDTPGTRLVFPGLKGSLAWLPESFSVTEAGADFYGGVSTFTYSLAPLGAGKRPAATFAVDYQNADLQTFSRAIQWRGMDLRGRVSGTNELRWDNGRLKSTLTGSGRLTVTPPEGVTLAASALDPSQPIAPPEPGPFQSNRLLGPLPVGGDIAYRFDPDGLELDPSWAASPTTYVAFQGRADYGTRSNLPFKVTSRDWQASDRILAAILTAAGARSGAVPVGGFGQFTGVMTGAFSQPRVAGAFAGEAVRSWGVTWGKVAGDIVIERQFVTVKNGAIGASPDQRIAVDDGRFALGFRPASESGEELKDAHIRIINWPLEDFRKAFGLIDWPVEGTVGAADLNLSGPYRGPLGSGTLRIDGGTAWGETFDSANGDLRFTGTGLEISRILMAKDVGRVTGSALIKWDGTYAFNAAGERIPVEKLTSFTVPKSPLSGVLRFTASGAGEFDAPAYTFKGSVPDLSTGSQGVGSVSGTLEVRDRTLFIPQFEAHSVLVQLSGSGSIALNDRYDSTLNLRFTNSRLDPYLPLVAPNLAAKLSQYTRAVVDGTVLVQGELKDVSALGVFVTVERADLSLFDYKFANDGPIRLQFENNTGTISQLVLTGADTRLTISGDVPRSSAPIAIKANGQANLAILRLIFPSDLASSGAATVDATIGGSLEQVTVSGEARITDGRLRYLAFPHGLEQINGPITFNTDRVSFDALRARMGDGDITFKGAVTLKGLVPDEYDVSAEGRSMSLRFPTGFRSTVNASLTLTGQVRAPTIAGEVTVLRSVYLQEIDNDQALMGLFALGAPAETGVPEPPSDDSVPVGLDLRIVAPSHRLIVDTANADILGAANLTVRGTVDRPSITGSVRIETGTVFINGNRYTMAPSSIDFFDPVQIRPSFDVTLQTRARVPAQTYDVTIRLAGESDRLEFTVNSDPYLPTYDLLSLLLGERYDLGRAEINAVQSSQLTQQLALRSVAAQFLTLPISSRIGSVVQRTIPCDTFAIVPTLGNEASLQSLQPGARVTCGKRLSERVFLTYSRALNATRQYDILLLEYEQSERTSWVLSRNEDRTFAIDFRIRHVF